MESYTLQEASASSLHRHAITERRPLSEASRVVSDVCGVNAQSLADAYRSLGCRLRDVDEEDVAHEVFETRRYGRTWCMRGTIHILAAEELPAYIQACAMPRMEEWHAWARKREPALTPAILPRMFERLAAALADGPKTRAELHPVLGGRLRRTRGRGQAFATHAMIHLGCNRGLCLPVARAGAENLYGLTKSWLGVDVESVSRDEARAWLARQYLKGFGPATPADLAYWSGWRMPEARTALAGIRDELADASVGDRTGFLVLAADRDRVHDAPDPPPRLLPRFDSLMLGHKDKSRFMDEASRKLVFGAAGNVDATVLVGGRVVGIWRHDWEGKDLRVTLRLFRNLSRGAHGSLRKEARDLGRFLGGREARITLWR